MTAAAATTPSSPLGPSKVASRLDLKKLTLAAIVAIAATGAAPLTVIAAGATTGWQVTEVTAIPVAYALTAVVLVLFSVGYTTMARMIPNLGAFYSYITHGLGRIPGVAAGYVALLAYNTMQVGLYGGWGPVAAALVAKELHLTLSWGWYAFAALAVIGILGLVRVNLVSKMLSFFLIGEVVIAIVYAVVELAHPAGGHLDTATINPAELARAGAGAVGAAMVLAIAGFVGFEITAVFSAETRDPVKTVPRATYLSVIGIGLLYTGCSWAMAVTVGTPGLIAAATSNGTELMFLQAARTLSPIWITVGHIFFATSLFAALLSFHLTSARYGYALGRDRVLPKFMAVSGRRFNAPIGGSLTQTGFAAAVLTIYVIMKWDPTTKLFFWLTVEGGLGVLVLMTFTSLAVMVYFRRHRELADDASVWHRFWAPLLSFTALAVILYDTIATFNVLLGVGGHDPTRWLLPGAFGAAAVLGVLVAAIIKAVQPAVFAGIGGMLRTGDLGADTGPAPAHARADTPAPGGPR